MKNQDVVMDAAQAPEPTAEAENQIVPEVTAHEPATQSPEPDPEAWSYMGSDGTSVIEITSLEVIDDDERKAVTGWMNQNKKPKKGQKLNTDDLIREGIGLIRDISAEANRQINVAHKHFADRAISIGLISLKLKSLVRGSKTPWGAWAEENLPFIARRNREKYMLIATRPDCWPFSFLGVDRLELLCSVTKGIKEKDPVGTLLRKYGIPFDEESEINMAEFKSRIDAAINNERLVKNGLTINFNLVMNIVNLGVDFDRSLIKRLKDVVECGGNPEALLEKISLSGGMEDMDVTPEKRLQDFNHLSNRLIKTLDFIMGEENQLEKIDRDTLEMLFEKLLSIKASLIADEEQAA